MPPTLTIEAKHAKKNACDVKAGSVFEYNGEYCYAMHCVKPVMYRDKPCTRNVVLSRGSIRLIPVDAQVRVVKAKEMILR
ncbi:MAG: hypothetical protein WDA42_00840 [Candidatus Bathyarchaeia archaeon]